jgi:predicted heme/steroid binding protein
MKIVINESRLIDISYKWLDDNFSDLHSSPDRLGETINFFNKRGSLILEYYPKYKKLWVSRSNIINVLFGMFNLNHEQVGDLIKKWSEDRYKLNPNRVFYMDDEYFEYLEE